jgi:RimJ/RimL family protein N-acetyltransferase
MMEWRRLQLRTARLLLRPWQRDDLEIMAAWAPFADPLEETSNWTAQLRAMSLPFFWAAHEADTTQHIWTLLVGDMVSGIVILHMRDAASATLGISLRESAQGRGYGREALSALFTAYFERCPHSTIRLEVALANRRAVALYRRLHFREVRRFWRDAGAPQRYTFLDDSRYHDVQAFFRRTDRAVYQLCAEMELGAEAWRRFVV